MYDVMAKKLFNIDTHRFDIKQETIAKGGFGYQRNDTLNGLSTTILLIVINWT